MDDSSNAAAAVAAKYAVSSSPPREDNWTGSPPPAPPLEQLTAARSRNEQELGRVQSCCALICLPTNAAAAVAMVAVGAVKVARCPVEPMIPKFLIVEGAVFLLLLLPRCVPRRKNGSIGEETKGVSRLLLRIFTVIASLFLLGWTVAFAFHVYRAWRPDFDGGDDPAADDHCDLLLYSFSFVLVTAAVTVMSMYPLFACCCCCLCLVHYCGVWTRNGRKRRRAKSGRMAAAMGAVGAAAVAPADAAVTAEEQV